MAAGDGAASRPLEEAGAFVTEVASSPRAPAPYPGRAGLYVVIAGPSPVRPMPADRWAREGYVGLLAVTNAGRTAAPFGDVHLDLDVRRGGESVDCVPGAREIGLPGPTTLPPGHTFLARFPVRCDLSTTADHEMLAAVTVGGSPLGGPACNVPSWPIAVTEDGFNDREVDQWRFDDRTGKNPFGL